MTSRVIVTNKLKLKEYPQRARYAINAMLRVISKDIESKALNEVTSHRYRGNLERGITAERYEEKSQLGVKCFVSGAAAKYGQVIHDQRDYPARKPPFAAIAAWVERKLKIPRDSEYFYPVVQSIRTNIAERGLKSIGPDGLEFFWGPMYSNQNKYMRDIGAAIERITL